jgi:hypothetical protein
VEIELRVGELNIQIHGRQFPKEEDFWDGNWLNVSATFSSGQSSVVTSGPIVHLIEIKRFQIEIEALYRTLEGTAMLDCMEPNLRIVLTSAGGGKVGIEISITPDHLKESHHYCREIDQSYLPPIIKECGKILELYPIRDPGDLID